jgi:hypothetical protein
MILPALPGVQRKSWSARCPANGRAGRVTSSTKAMSISDSDRTRQDRHEGAPAVLEAPHRLPQNHADGAGTHHATTDAERTLDLKRYRV